MNLWRLLDRSYTSAGRDPERPTQPRDPGEETEADGRELALTEFADMAAPAVEFVEMFYELTLAVAKAAIVYDTAPSEVNRLELVRAVDQAREAYVEWRTRV